MCWHSVCMCVSVVGVEVCATGVFGMSVAVLLACMLVCMVLCDVAACVGENFDAYIAVMLLWRWSVCVIPGCCWHECSPSLAVYIPGVLACVGMVLVCMLSWQ